jgi:hypothetical protein
VTAADAAIAREAIDRALNGPPCAVADELLRIMMTGIDGARIDGISHGRRITTAEQKAIICNALVPVGDHEVVSLEKLADNLHGRLLGAYFDPKRRESASQTALVDAFAALMQLQRDTDNRIIEDEIGRLMAMARNFPYLTDPLVSIISALRTVANLIATRMTTQQLAQQISPISRPDEDAPSGT